MSESVVVTRASRTVRCCIVLLLLWTVRPPGGHAAAPSRTIIYAVTLSMDIGHVVVGTGDRSATVHAEGKTYMRIRQLGILERCMIDGYVLHMLKNEVPQVKHIPPTPCTPEATNTQVFGSINFANLDTQRIGTWQVTRRLTVAEALQLPVDPPIARLLHPVPWTSIYTNDGKTTLSAAGTGTLQQNLSLQNGLVLHVQFDGTSSLRARFNPQDSRQIPLRLTMQQVGALSLVGSDTTTGGPLSERDSAAFSVSLVLASSLPRAG